jgi:uroporphyrinogen-III synthase
LSPLPAPAPGGWTRPTVVVTRPHEDARRWVLALQDAGWSALALPLIEIRSPSSPAAQEALMRARRACWDFDALMFVSAAAVRHFIAGVAPYPRSGGQGPRFWAPGPGTARALAQALGHLGVPPDRIDAPPADAGQFDSEHLWPQVQSQMVPGRRLLVVRGGGLGSHATSDGSVPGQGREWLIEQCRSRGVVVEACMAYERATPADRTALGRQALAAQGPRFVWLFSSSEAVNHLALVEPTFRAAGTAALATHPRIAAAARSAGFAPVLESRPAMQDVLAALESQWP